MRSLIKMQISRYPVFDVIPPKDFPFNHDNSKRAGVVTHQSARSSQQKNSIYGYKKEANEQSEQKSEFGGRINSKKKKSIQKYISELAHDIDDPKNESDYGQGKFKVLKRIIEHYDIKNMEKQEYSKLIKTFGLQIDSAKTSKKQKQGEERKKNFTIKPTTTRGYSRNSRLKNRIESRDGDRDREVALLQFSRELVPSQNRNNPTANSTRNSKIFNKSAIEKVSKLKISDSRSSSPDKSKKISPLKFKSKMDVVVEKVNKYREFLFAINYSNFMYRDMQIHSYEKPLKFYVGSGNNSNLIKSLMRKRHYFQQTNKIKEANFVWTQIKVEWIFDQQKGASSPFDTCFRSKLDSPEKDRRLVITRNGSSHSNNNEENLSRILLKRETLEILKAQEDNQKRNFACNFEDRLKLLRRRIVCRQFEDNEIVHNHLPSNGLIGNKKGLFYCLREYYKLTSRNVWEILPLTFHITKGILDNEFKQFQHYYQERKKNKMANYWIMKPGEFSNRGNGIQCSNKIDDIKKRVMKCQSGRNGKSPQTVILQYYINTPLLYNNRKFDIRTFMLVTCHNGKIKGYWYQEGYIRTSSYLFNLSEITDNDIHLTNDAIQKQLPNYGKYEAGNKLSYQELQRYLDSLPANGRNLDIQSVLIPKMKKIAAESLMSSFLFIDQNRKQDNFEIFGLDFLIDSQFNPWLIEINTNPCLELSCPLLERIIPYMTENAFRIGLDTIFPPPDVIPHNHKYNIAENALHYNKFELIFDENRDGPQIRSLYDECPSVASTISSLMNLQEDQQVFEEQGILCDYDI